jgi:hypothetical protein
MYSFGKWGIFFLNAPMEGSRYMNDSLFIRQETGTKDQWGYSGNLMVIFSLPFFTLNFI